MRNTTSTFHLYPVHTHPRMPNYPHKTTRISVPGATTKTCNLIGRNLTLSTPFPVPLSRPPIRPFTHPPTFSVRWLVLTATFCNPNATLILD